MAREHAATAVPDPRGHAVTSEATAAIGNVQVVSPPVEANAWPPLTEVHHTEMVVKEAHDPEYWYSSSSESLTF